jgi:hypothetical protein
MILNYNDWVTLFQEQNVNIDLEGRGLSLMDVKKQQLYPIKPVLMIQTIQ